MVLIATSAIEDTGTISTLAALANAKRVDIDRVLILLTTRNFTIEHEGSSAVASLVTEGTDYSALRLALEAAYVVGSTVVEEIIANWDRYAGNIHRQSSVIWTMKMPA